MSQFLYFLPARQTPVFHNDPLLESLGLSTVLGDKVGSVKVARGPNDQGGYLVYRDIPADKLDDRVKHPHRVAKEEQTWVEWAGYWVGFWKEAPPSPEELERGKSLASHPVELADGNEWKAPICRRITGESGLPTVIFQDKDGALVYEVDDEYKFFQEAAEREYRQLMSAWGVSPQGEGDEPFTDQELFDIAVGLLGLNYRIGKAELAAMKLLTKQGMFNVVKAMIDFPSFEILEKALDTSKESTESEGSKKKEPDTPVTQESVCSVDG